MLRPSPQPDLLKGRQVFPKDCQSQPQHGEHQQLRHGQGQTDGGCAGARSAGRTCLPACLQPQSLCHRQGLARRIPPRQPPPPLAPRPSPWAGRTEGGASFGSVPACGQELRGPRDFKRGNHGQLPRLEKKGRIRRWELIESRGKGEPSLVKRLTLCQKGLNVSASEGFPNLIPLTQPEKAWKEGGRGTEGHHCVSPSNPWLSSISFSQHHS